MKKRDHLEDNGRDRSAISNRMVTKQVGGEDWIDLAQDSDKSWAFVNRVMKLRVP